MVEVEAKGVPVDGTPPVIVKKDDYEEIDKIQVLAESLNHVRQEIGRLHQVVAALREKADELEVDLANKRRDLAAEYDLKVGQWSLDFETKEFKRLSPGAPVIP